MSSTTLSLPSQRLAPSAPCQLAQLASAVDAPDLWDSQKLLQGQKSIVIVHNGMAYRLQATKLGKLILTK